MRKLNRKQERYLVCGSVASSHVLIFAVIGHDTIHIHEIFVHGFPRHTVSECFQQLEHYTMGSRQDRPPGC